MYKILRPVTGGKTFRLDVEDFNTAELAFSSAMKTPLNPFIVIKFVDFQERKVSDLQTRAGNRRNRQVINVATGEYYASGLEASEKTGLPYYQVNQCVNEGRSFNGVFLRFATNEEILKHETE